MSDLCEVSGKIPVKGIIKNGNYLINLYGDIIKVTNEKINGNSFYGEWVYIISEDNNGTLNKPWRLNAKYTWRLANWYKSKLWRAMHK